MLALRTIIIACALLALILSVGADGHNKVARKRSVVVPTNTADSNAWICQYMPQMASWMGISCKNQQPSTTTTSMTSQKTTSSSTTDESEVEDTTSTAAVSSSSSSDSSSTSTDSSTISSSASPLERATWCRLNNGTYLALDLTFMNGLCTMCRCTENRFVRCSQFQCMPTYCIDNTSPFRKEGQCCTQCGSDLISNKCTYQGVSYPHGVIIKSDKQMKCWCQLGQIECRTGMPSLFDGLDLWGDGTALYVILVILAVVLIFGSLLCCGCTVFFYYYYKRNQETFQQAYDQYYNSAGWQPMTEEEGLANATGDDKQAEAEQGQLDSEQYLTEIENPTTPSQVYMPPPYALYNGAYVSEDQHNNQKKL